MFNYRWMDAFQQYRGMLRSEPCSYCGGTAGHIDHIVAKSRGGGYFWDNFTPACLKCNSYKGDQRMLIFLVQRGGIGHPAAALRQPKADECRLAVTLRPEEKAA